MKGAKNHSNCIVCQSSSLNELPLYESAFLCQCNSCGFVFSKRIPSEQERTEHYQGHGRQDYLSEVTTKQNEELLESFEPYRKTNRILDVGCGIGYFLEVAKRKGWEVYGTEFTSEDVEICEAKGIQMHKGILDPDNYNEQFDVITSFEVLEHINNPQEEISNFKKILRKGGLVYLTTPNFNSLLRYRPKSKYSVITYPEHLSYYTPKTIRSLFKIHQPRKIRVETTGISLNRLRNGKVNGSKEKTEKPISAISTDEKLRKSAENNKIIWFAKKLMNKLLSIFGVGDSLKVRFEKI